MNLKFDRACLYKIGFAQHFLTTKQFLLNLKKEWTKKKRTSGDQLFDPVTDQIYHKSNVQIGRSQRLGAFL